MSDREPRRIAHWIEDDVHTGWRHIVSIRPEVIRWTKRWTNRRERRERREDTRRRIHEETEG